MNDIRTIASAMDRRSFLVGSLACVSVSAIPESSLATASRHAILIEDNPDQTSRWQRVLGPHRDSLWVVSEPTALLDRLECLVLDAAPAITGITRSAGELLGRQILGRAGYQPTPALRTPNAAQPDSSLICWQFVLTT